MLRASLAPRKLVRTVPARHDQLLDYVQCLRPQYSIMIHDHYSHGCRPQRLSVTRAGHIENGGQSLPCSQLRRRPQRSRSVTAGTLVAPSSDRGAPMSRITWEALRGSAHDVHCDRHDKNLTNSEEAGQNMLGRSQLPALGWTHLGPNQAGPRQSEWASRQIELKL